MKERLIRENIKKRVVTVARVGAVAVAIGGSGYTINDMYDSYKKEQAEIDEKCGGPARQNCVTREQEVCGVFANPPLCSKRTIYEVKTPVPESELFITPQV